MTQRSPQGTGWEIPSYCERCSLSYSPEFPFPRWFRSTGNTFSAPSNSNWSTWWHLNWLLPIRWSLTRRDVFDTEREIREIRISINYHHMKLAPFLKKTLNLTWDKHKIASCQFSWEQKTSESPDRLNTSWVQPIKWAPLCMTLLYFPITLLRTKLSVVNL